MSNRNIVHIISHDLGRHLGCYGAGVATPNCDRIAAAGVRFDRCFCSSPLCSPSRASLMSGLHPQRNGIIGLCHNGWRYRPGIATVTHLLAQAGYQTHLFGGHHETPVDHRDPADRRRGAEELGYQHFHDTAPGLIADAPWNYIGACHSLVADRLDGIVAEGRPFFLNIGTPGAHRPFRDLRGINRHADDGRPGVAFLPGPGAGVRVPPYLRDCEGVRADLAYLDAFARREDEFIGRIFAEFARRGLLESTLFVVTTDHGVAMPRAKGMCYDPGIGVYLLMHHPGLVRSGAVEDALVCGMDLMPTYLAYAGVDIPEGLDGRSLLPLLSHPGGSHRQHIFAEENWEIIANPVRCVRTAGFKYLRNHGILPRVSMTADVFSGRAGEAMHGDCYYYRREAEELYDLAADPWERDNLLANGRPHPERDHLAGLLEGWMAGCGDPLATGGQLPTNPEQERVRVGWSPYFFQVGGAG